MTAALRALEARDRGLLRKMLIAALLWRPKRRLWPTSALLLFPQLAIFYRGWGRAGDTGIVAEEDGKRIGVVWYRFFTDESHGEGYVGSSTPELAVAVVAAARGRGVGRALMEAIHDRARRDGVRFISLSVDPENPARRLYASLGYRELTEREGDDRMLLEL